MTTRATITTTPPVNVTEILTATHDDYFSGDKAEAMWPVLETAFKQALENLGHSTTVEASDAVSAADYANLVESAKNGQSAAQSAYVQQMIRCLADIGKQLS